MVRRPYLPLGSAQQPEIPSPRLKLFPVALKFPRVGFNGGWGGGGGRVGVGSNSINLQQTLLVGCKGRLDPVCVCVCVCATEPP